MGFRETQEGLRLGRELAWAWAAASEGNLWEYISMGRERRVAAEQRVPEDIAELVRDEDRATRTRDRDLRRFFEDLSARRYRSCRVRREGDGVAHRSLKSCRLSSAQTLSRLSSPAVARCAYSASIAAQRTGPAFSNPSNSAPSRETVERSSSPVLRINSRRVSEGSQRDVL